MKELTKDNHFKIGYNNNWFNTRKSPNDKWNVKYGRCTQEPGSFRDECEKAAKIIRERTNKRINVLFSGGIDSEVVVRSFINSGIEINCVICDLCGYNLSDIKHAISFCKNFNISFEIITLDIKEFWKLKLNKKAEITKCISPQFPVLMWLSDQIEGYNIIGSGDCFLKKNYDKWFMVEREKVASIYRYYILKDKDGAPAFFQYSPELILSFLNEPLLREFLEETKMMDSKNIKPAIYKKYWKDIKPRKKLTGYEKLEDLDLFYRSQLENKFKGSNDEIFTEYQELIDSISPIKISECSHNQIEKYKILYKLENLDIERNPFSKKVLYSNYFVAKIGEKLAGITCFDILKDGRIYHHSALTIKRFRNMGVNTALWNYKIKKLKALFPGDCEMITINPDWIHGAKIMKNRLLKIGFKINSYRPDGSPLLTCKLLSLKETRDEF